MKLPILMLTFCLFIQVSGQVKQEYETRQVIITYEDSIVHTGIITKQVSLKINPDLWYYWYFPDQINLNKGGYHGNLLHGPYIVFDNKKKMISAGNYDKGLKSGIWKTWYPNGNMKSLIIWNCGLLESKDIYFNPDGSIYQSIEYKHGKRNGEYLHFINDSLVHEQYKNDLLVDKKDRQPGILKMFQPSKKTAK